MKINFKLFFIFTLVATTFFNVCFGNADSLIKVNDFIFKKISLDEEYHLVKYSYYIKKSNKFFHYADTIYYENFKTVFCCRQFYKGKYLYSDVHYFYNYADEKFGALQSKSFIIDSIFNIVYYNRGEKLSGVGVYNKKKNLIKLDFFKLEEYRIDDSTLEIKINNQLIIRFNNDHTLRKILLTVKNLHIESKYINDRLITKEYLNLKNRKSIIEKFNEFGL